MRMVAKSKKRMAVLFAIFLAVFSTGIVIEETGLGTANSQESPYGLEIGKGLDLSRPSHAQLLQFFWPLPIDQIALTKSVVEATGFEPAPDAW